MNAMRHLTLTLVVAALAAWHGPAAGAGNDGPRPGAAGATPLLLAQASGTQGGEADGRPRKVYRWTDESGETHFGYYKPRDRDAEPVDIRLPARTPQEEPTEEEPTEEDEGQAGREGGPPADLTEAEREAYSANCRIARENLETLQQDPDRLLERNAEGEMVPVDKEQYEARREQARKNVERFCE